MYRFRFLKAPVTSDLKFGLSGLNKLCSSASLVFQGLSGPKMHEKAFYSQEEGRRKEGRTKWTCRPACFAAGKNNVERENRVEEDTNEVEVRFTLTGEEL